jgi:hypothetical protein
MTLNSLKIRIEKLSRSKHKFHVFTIRESDPPEVKEKIRQQIEALKRRGEDPLLITIRTIVGPDNLERK